MIVERHVVSRLEGAAAAAGQPGPGRVLRDVDRVLFAAAKKVDGVNPEEIANTRAVLTEHLGDRFEAAGSWTDWRGRIKTHRPGLLLALPHNETGDGKSILFIGAKSKLDVGAMTKGHLMPADTDVGPVVMLLGCDTAHADVDFQSAAAAFRLHGATVVVGTLVQALGRQTAPMARMLVDALWGPESEPTIGEVIRTVRRRLIAEGWTLGMSLVAFGDGGWRTRPEVV
jgi:hypothetical protein